MEPLTFADCLIKLSCEHVMTEKAKMPDSVKTVLTEMNAKSLKITTFHRIEESFTAKELFDVVKEMADSNGVDINKIVIAFAERNSDDED